MRKEDLKLLLLKKVADCDHNILTEKIVDEISKLLENKPKTTLPMPLSVPMTTTTSSSSSKPYIETIVFEISVKGTSGDRICICGFFNDWSTKLDLTCTDGTIWQFTFNRNEIPLEDTFFKFVYVKNNSFQEKWEKEPNRRFSYNQIMTLLEKQSMNSDQDGLTWNMANETYEYRKMEHTLIVRCNKVTF